MADQSLPLRRYLSANLVALAPSGVALATLHWTGALAGRPALIAFLGIAVVTVILVQRYLVSLGRFARFVGELSGEREPVMPRLSFAPATEELATAAATLATGWRRQRASIDNLAASAQAIVDGLPDPLIGVDRQRRIVRTNRAAVALLGTMVPDRDLSTALRHPELLAAIDSLLATTDGNFTGPDQVAVALVLSGAPELDVMAHARRLPRAAADGSLALIVLHDTTALRRAERMRADFVANASHELKTPIAGIMGFIETLRGPARDDAAARERFLGIMAEQAERMRRLVDDLLTLSRIEQHEHARPAAAVDVGRVLAGRARSAAAQGLVAQGHGRAGGRSGAAAGGRRLRRADHRVPEPDRQRDQVLPGPRPRCGSPRARSAPTGSRWPSATRATAFPPRTCRASPSASTGSTMPARASSAAPASASRSSSTSSTATAAGSTSRACPARARSSR